MALTAAVVIREIYSAALTHRASDTQGATPAQVVIPYFSLWPQEQLIDRSLTPVSREITM